MVIYAMFLFPNFKYVIGHLDNRSDTLYYGDAKTHESVSARVEVLVRNY